MKKNTIRGTEDHPLIVPVKFWFKL